jgi:regulator of sirC expression with transglutaminase-like and TPR domain
MTESRRTLRLLGARAIPFLEDAARQEDARLRARARLARDDVRVHLLERDLQRLGAALDERTDALEECTILLARSRYPDLEPATIHAALDAMADDLATRIHGLSSPLARARTLCRFLAGELGFHGNQRNYYDPDNSYLNRVLERRKGIPISLSSVYLFVGRRLGLPLSGIGMPGYFLIRFGEGNRAIYIDTFLGGRLLTEEECLRTLQAGDRRHSMTDLVTMTDGAILLRMMRNLQLIYSNRAEGHRLAVLERLKRVLLSKEEREDEAAGTDGSSSYRAPES